MKVPTQSMFESQIDPLVLLCMQTPDDAHDLWWHHTVAGSPAAKVAHQRYLDLIDATDGMETIK